jgi:methyl-accepting chemotaxis protein
LTCLLAVLVLATSLVTGVFTFTSSRHLVTSTIGAEAEYLAQKALASISVSDFAALLSVVGQTSPDQATLDSIMAMPEYNRVREALYEVKAASRLKYIYAMAMLDNGQYIYVVEGYKDQVADDPSLPGDVETGGFSGMVAAFATGTTQIGDLYQTEDYGALLSAFVPIKDASGKMIGLVGADYDATNIYSLLRANQSATLGITGAVLAAALLCGYVFAHILVKPVRQLAAAAEEIKRGDLTAEVAGSGKDEVGRLARAFGDMTASLRTVIGQIHSGADGVQAAADAISGSAAAGIQGAAQIAAAAQKLSAGAEHQQSSLNDVVAAIEEASAGIEEIAATAQEVATSTEKASAIARSGNEEMARATSEMDAISNSTRELADFIQKLGERSADIGQITDLISGVARQTNLLALNAAIEAARAGEAGRGFAVVADQVRQLSEQVREAAQGIAKLISEVQSGTERAVAATNKNMELVAHGSSTIASGAEAFRQIAEAVEQVLMQVSEVSKSTDEMAKGSEDIVNGATAIEEITRQVAASARDMAETTEKQTDVMNQSAAGAASLNSVVSTLQKSVEEFRVS